MKNRIAAVGCLLAMTTTALNPSLDARADGFRLSRPSDHMQTGGVDFQDAAAVQPPPSPPNQLQSGTMDNSMLRSGDTQNNLRGGATDGGGLNGPLSASADLGNPTRKLIPGGTRQLSSNELANLSHHDIVLLIDKSSSMDEIDCPSMENRSFFISRWNWCREQTIDLARQTAAVLPQGISVLLFSWTTSIFPHVDMRAIPRIFADNHPGGMTNEANAIGAVLDDYFQRRAAGRGKVAPMLIAIVTDGRPTSESAVRNRIIEATQNLKSADEIKITFLLIGQDPKGLGFIQEMDRGLVSQGAKFDIVSSKPFPDLVRTGLASALVDCISEPASSPLMDALNNAISGKSKKHH